MTKDSDKHSKESKDLLDGMKKYLKIQQQDDDELLNYLRKQAGLHQRDKY